MKNKTTIEHIDVSQKETTKETKPTFVATARKFIIKWGFILGVASLLGLFLVSLYDRKDILIWSYTHEEEARFAKIAWDKTQEMVKDSYKDKLAK